MKPNVGVVNPDTDKPFIDHQETPAGESVCGSCGTNLSTMKSLTHYPVRIACGDVFCYGDVDRWLNACELNNCPRCNSPLEDFSLARKNIDSQIEHYRKALEMEERLSALAYSTATLSLQPKSSSSEPSSTSEMKERDDSLSTRAAALQLQESDEGSAASSISDEDLVENVVAALSFLDLTPSQASKLDLSDLVETLSVLDLPSGDSAIRLMGVLELVTK